jgi:hypothetical protein
MSFTQDSVKNCEEACSQEFFFPMMKLFLRRLMMPAENTEHW